MNRTLALILGIAAIVGGVAACSDDDTTDAEHRSPDMRSVEIGPGSEGPAPAEQFIGAPEGTEPEWAAALPAPVRRSANRLSAAAVYSASGGLRWPKFGNRRPTSTTTAARGADPEESSPALGTYRGTLTMEIAYYNYCVTYDGNLSFAGSESYDSDVDVYVNAAAEDDGVQERSPFNLIVSSELGVEGSLMAVSAQVVADPQSGKTALFDYWRITERSGDISGILTDRWPGFAVNTVTTAQPLVPCTPGFTLAQADQLAEGTKLTGMSTGEDLELTIVGQSLDREIRFKSTIRVQRANDDPRDD